jgi:hypothetical protein
MAEQATESSPVLDFLRGLIDTQKNSFAKAASREPTPLRMWVYTIRSQLERIYGKNSHYLNAFPMLSEDPPRAQVPVIFAQRSEQLRRIIADLEALVANSVSPLRGRRVFIGHGHSPLWRELKDFIADRLGLPWDEFNREEVAGYTTSERLQTMLSQAAFAFLIMTAEEEHRDATVHARPNVIHEIGLFQGRLGLQRAIVLLEDGCSEFSNIRGLTYIGFPQGDISARFDNIRRVLEREKLI